MNTISGIVDGISSNAGMKNVSAFDLSDTTFADLLQKEIDSKKDESLSNIFTSFGVPVDFQIQEVNLDDIGNQTIKSISQTDKKQENENMLQFAKKQATQFYNKYSGSVVTDLEEFVSDALKIN